MKKLLFAAVVVLALAVPGSLSAAGDVVHVSGSGVGSSFLLGDHVEVGSAGDAAGTWANGHLEVEGTLETPSGALLPVHQAAHVVCVRVRGNRGVVVGRFDEPFTTDLLPGFVFTGAAVIVEDNGPPVHGQPVDRMVDFTLREQTLERFCNTDYPFTLDFLLTPIESGNFVVDD